MWARSLLYELLKLDHTTFDTLSTISFVDATTLPWRQEAISSAGILWCNSVKKRSYRDSTSVKLICGNAESSVSVAESVVIRTSIAPSTSDRCARSGSPDICDSNNSTTASIVFKGKCFILWRILVRLPVAAERALAIWDIFPSLQLSKSHEHFPWFRDSLKLRDELRHAFLFTEWSRA